MRGAVVDGSVRVEAGLEVLRPGFFRFDANLYGAGEQPVGYALFKGELAAGPSEVPLVFYGKVLRDAGVTGPFTLGELRGYRFLEGAYPDRERLPDDPQRHPLGDLPLASLTDAAHVSAHELRMVELMMEDLARGISLEAPPPPGPDPAAAPADPGAPTARRPAASPR